MELRHTIMVQGMHTLRKSSTNMLLKITEMGRELKGRRFYSEWVLTW